MLRYNQRSGEFFLVTREAERAREAGLTRSTSARGPQGEDVFFTDSTYAALPFYREADESAQARLAPLWSKYEKSWAKESPNKYPVGPGAKAMGYEFMGYQNAGIDYALEQDHTIIGDGMGLGKTAEAIGVNNVRGAEHNLVLCPANVRKNWKREILNWSTIPNPLIYPIYKGKDGVNPYANYTIVSYELLQNEGIHKALYQQKFDSFIIDEGHYLKTTDAKRTQAVFGGGRGIYAKQALFERASNVLELTGTLLPNRPRECWTAVKHLSWQAVDYCTQEDFFNRYNPRGQLDNGHWLEAKGRLPELQARLRCNLMVRRLKEDVLKDLPDKRYELTYIEPDGAISEVLRQERLLNFSVDDLRNPFAEIWGQISTLRLMMGLAALPRMVEHIRYLLDIVEVPKIVVFSWHREVMDRLFAALDPMYGVVEVRGGMSSGAKEGAIEAFKTNPDKRIFHGQLIAAGVGIDGLQNVCSHCVITEPDWVPGNNEQAADRLHRIGQHDNVLIQLMCVEDSLLERILAANFTKVKGIHASLDLRT